VMMMGTVLDTQCEIRYKEVVDDYARLTQARAETLSCGGVGARKVRQLFGDLRSHHRVVIEVVEYRPRHSGHGERTRTIPAWHCAYDQYLAWGYDENGSADDGRATYTSQTSPGVLHECSK